MRAGLFERLHTGRQAPVESATGAEPSASTGGRGPCSQRDRTAGRAFKARSCGGYAMPPALGPPRLTIQARRIRTSRGRGPRHDRGGGRSRAPARSDPRRSPSSQGDARTLYRSDPRAVVLDNPTAQHALCKTTVGPPPPSPGDGPHRCHRQPMTANGGSHTPSAVDPSRPCRASP
jgi:hypothetical protein